MTVRFLLALTGSEMGVSSPVLALILIPSVIFIVGFVKSSRENEYKRLMDSFIERKEESN